MTGMLVVGLGLLGVAGYYAVLIGPIGLSIIDAGDAHRAASSWIRWSRWASAPR